MANIHLTRTGTLILHISNMIIQKYNRNYVAALLEIAVWHTQED